VAKLPDPPAPGVLRRLTPPIVTLAGSAALARVYFGSSAHPVSWNEFRHWGPGSAARFDHHQTDTQGRSQTQSRGIFYCAPQAITCIAEVFQHARVIDRTTDDPYLCVFSLRRPLRLLDLTGEFATRMGASAAIHSGPRHRSRRWAAALYDAFDHDGLLYLSSMHPGAQAMALNERCSEALPASPDFNRPLADPSLTDVVDACAFRLGYLKG
jgi:hypothetical protein